LHHDSRKAVAIHLLNWSARFLAALRESCSNSGCNSWGEQEIVRFVSRCECIALFSSAENKLSSLHASSDFQLFF